MLTDSLIFDKMKTQGANMIEELIEEGQYQVALSRLTDMDDEMTRYYRLVCLNALEDYQRCMQEGAVAKMQANNTYYEVTALYLNALKELEEYEQAINILIEELSMPYIPQQYENLFNAVYDEIILMKQGKELPARKQEYHYVCTGNWTFT